jgi:hypothetical protein
MSVYIGTFNDRRVGGNNVITSICSKCFHHQNSYFSSIWSHLRAKLVYCGLNKEIIYAENMPDDVSGFRNEVSKRFKAPKDCPYLLEQVLIKENGGYLNEV